MATKVEVTELKWDVMNEGTAVTVGRSAQTRAQWWVYRMSSGIFRLSVEGHCEPLFVHMESFLFEHLDQATGMAQRLDVLLYRAQELEHRLVRDGQVAGGVA